VPAGVDSAVSLLITRCWAQQPIDRPSFAEIFRELCGPTFSAGKTGFEPDRVSKYIDWIRKCTRQ
jgi:hypothetical protein